VAGTAESDGLRSHRLELTTCDRFEAVGHVVIGIHEHAQGETVALVDEEDARAMSLVDVTSDEPESLLVAIGPVR
jgi:hypothetical protein